MRYDVWMELAVPHGALAPELEDPMEEECLYATCPNLRTAETVRACLQIHRASEWVRFTCRPYKDDARERMRVAIKRILADCQKLRDKYPDDGAVSDTYSGGKIAGRAQVAATVLGVLEPVEGDVGDAS